MLKLIKNIGTRQIKCGRIDSFGLFLCESCGKEVERVLAAGRRNKTCGCRKKSYIDRTCLRCGKQYKQKVYGRVIETSKHYCRSCVRYFRYYRKRKGVCSYEVLPISVD